MKKCCKCNLDKDINLFYANKKSKDGKDSYCKDCRNGITNDYDKDNKEKRYEYQKNYINRNKEKVNERAKLYYHKNKEKIKLKNKEGNIIRTMKWRKKNSEEYKAYQKTYQKAYREKKKLEKNV